MSVISFSQFNESEMARIFFKFAVLCNDIQNVFRGDGVPSREKDQDSSGIKSLFSNAPYGFEYKKLQKYIAY